MMLTNEQYERVGRYLDGEALALTDAERAVAEELRRDEAAVGGLFDADPPAGLTDADPPGVMLAEIRRDEAALAALLDAPVPPAALERAKRRVVAELARPARWRRRIGVAAASMAAAAAILLAVVLLPGPDSGGRRGDLAGADKPVPVEVIVASIRGSDDPAINLLAKEINQLEAEMFASAPPASLDMGIDQVQDALEGFWLDEMLD